MITRVCQHCGKGYETFPSIKPKFCSSACAGAAKVTSAIVPCVHCGETFKRHACRPGRRYCSKSCAMTARNLTDANPAHHRDVSGANNPMYGRGMRGEDNPMYGRRKNLAPRWTGGVRVRPDGYCYAVADDDHPNPAYTNPSGTKYALLHRLVMERHLGRYLTTSEVVHHRDGNPTNNAIENLELFASQADHIRHAHGPASAR
jgi:hypothetical protein